MEAKTPPLPRKQPTGEGKQPDYSQLWGVGQMSVPICALQVPPGGSLGEVLTGRLKDNAERQSTQAPSAFPSLRAPGNTCFK